MVSSLEIQKALQKIKTIWKNAYFNSHYNRLYLDLTPSYLFIQINKFTTYDSLIYDAKLYARITFDRQ